MNSSTSSSSFRRFGLGFLILAFAPGLCLFYLGIWLEPLAGDLTRIGGFSERDYGWITPQLGFKDPLPVDEGAYHARDLWVLGDSFATAWPKLQWQNHLKAKTGWSIGTQNINRTSISRLLEDPEFKAHPPKVLIIESAERYLALRLKELALEPSGKASSPLKAAFSGLAEPKPYPLAREPLLRNSALGDIQIPFAARYLLRAFQREVLGQSPGNTLRLKLKWNGLFSDRDAGRLLVFREDFQKEAMWREMGIEAMSDRLERLRTRVEAHGATRLVVLIAPDKLTAYGDALDETHLNPYSELGTLIARKPELLPDTLGAMRRGVQDGTPDLYLPNDTHWGASGQEKIADTVLDFLKARPSQPHPEKGSHPTR